MGIAVYTLIDFVSATFVALRNCCRVHRTTSALLAGGTKSLIAAVGTHVATRQFGKYAPMNLKIVETSLTAVSAVTKTRTLSKHRGTCPFYDVRDATDAHIRAA